MATRFEKVEDLTEEQKQVILTYIQGLVREDSGRPAIKDLVKLINPEADGRSYLGKAIKNFLEGKGIKYDTTRYIPEGTYLLDAEEQDLIIQKLSVGETSTLKIAREIFENDNLTPLDSETLAVIAFSNEYKLKVPETPSNGLDSYNPPKTLGQIIRKTNSVLNDKRYIEDNLTSREQKQLTSLRLNLHSPRFAQMWKSFLEEEHRNLFEASLIRMIHDKDDINEAELNTFIELGYDQTDLAKIGIQKALLEKRLKSVTEDEDGKIPQSLIEAYNAITKEIENCRSRIEKNTKALNSTRAERLKNRNEKSVNFASLVEAFREEKTREIFIKNAERNKELLKGEIDRLESMDALKCRILGISRSEILDD